MASKLTLSPGRNLTRADLNAAVYARTPTSKRQSADLVDMLLAEIVDALGGGEDVKLASFGAFVVRAKHGRIGRNPKTGVEAPIVARRVVLFRASGILHDHVRGVGDAGLQFRSAR